MSNRQLKDQIQSRVPEIETRDVPKYRQCPICYNGQGGTGICDGSYKKASTLTRRYYKCNNCSRTWTADITPEQVRNMPDAVADGIAAEIKS